ncbi:tail fiber protein [Flavobacterium sp. F-65]|jgi:hypothetical protein|uniref:Tail fiber protein n=1 Tax=Flavobacterium pisciphilum TaxID=2893755 RepID=A0ABS8MXT4_9FLAO|nr:tail fiber protein [Flavobacterium sp. F-65]MCC9073591.1 tail fiber protein [Flavobacterium sp. F-65]
MKKRIFIGLLVLGNLLLTNAQNATFDNVTIGLNAPDWGVNIKTNFPGLTGSWNRGFFISNETGLQHLFSIGANGNSVNGISSFTSGFIGTDWKNQYMSFLPNGNIGIGTETPLVNLHIKNQTAHLRLESSDVGYNASIQYVSGGQYRWELGTGIFSGPNFELYNRINNKYSLVVTPEGNIGIGITNPDEKLTVNGKIHAQEVRIDLQSPMTVPDYVFANDYKLKSLQEVEEFIKQNSHLPEIPSAKEIEKNGLMLAEMNMSLLKKIEELTLYMIEMKKENEEMKKNQLKLEKRINTIENK